MYDSNNRGGNNGNLNMTKEGNDTIDNILSGMKNPYAQDQPNQ